MVLLALDTSQNTTYLSLYENLGLLGLEKIAQPSQSNFLLPTIETLLERFGFSLKDLDLIAVCNGPGSFTGTRIGVMTAKTLSYARGIPLASFNSLIPYQLEGRRAVIPAKGEEFFILVEGQPTLITLQDLMEIKEPLASPEDEYIREMAPGQDVVKSLFDPNLLLREIDRRYETQTFENPKLLDVCYLRSPIKR